MSNQRQGLAHLFAGAAAMSSAAVAGCLMIKGLYDGVPLFSCGTFGLAGAAAFFSALGHVDIALGADLLNRQEGDLSPPDPIIREFPLVGGLLCKIAERVIAASQIDGDRGSENPAVSSPEPSRVPTPVL
ncbi:MAG TPA: hypothetical protein PKX87_03380 [Alphaproteobacteria bacterium]|nr:hypothetical protein [Alphaproteobacteria bacterium]